MSRKDTALKYFNEQKELTDIRVKSGIELNRKGDAYIVPSGSWKAGRRGLPSSPAPAA